jgi:hypothetical protein
MSRFKFILEDISNVDFERRKTEYGLYFKVLYVKPKLFGNIDSIRSNTGLLIYVNYWPYISSYHENEIYIGNGIDHKDKKDLSTCVFFKSKELRDAAKIRILESFKELISKLS